MGEKTVMFLLFIHISCVGKSKRKEVKLKEAVNLKDLYSMFSKIKGCWALRFDKLQESEWERQSYCPCRLAALLIISSAFSSFQLATHPVLGVQG